MKLARPKRSGTGRDLAKEALWRETLARWRNAGTTQAEFCRKEHLNENTFSTWKKVIHKRDAGTVRKPAETTVGKKEQSKPAFVRLELAENLEPVGDSAGRQKIGAQDHFDQTLVAEIIDLAKGTRLRIYNGADQSTFAALLAAFSKS